MILVLTYDNHQFSESLRSNNPQVISFVQRCDPFIMMKGTRLDDETSRSIFVKSVLRSTPPSFIPDLVSCTSGISSLRLHQSHETVQHQQNDEKIFTFSYHLDEREVELLKSKVMMVMNPHK